MAPHSSTLAQKIPWTEEPGRLQSKGSLRVRHDCETSLSCIGEGNANPLQCSCLENPRDRGVWWAAVYGVAQSQTRLKRLSSSRDLIFSTENFTQLCSITSMAKESIKNTIAYMYMLQLNQSIVPCGQGQNYKPTRFQHSISMKLKERKVMLSICPESIDPSLFPETCLT